jgi:hypothetical protein
MSETARWRGESWMKQRNRCIVLVLILFAGLQLIACSPSDVGHKEEPAHVEPIEGTDLSRIELTARAAQRLAVETAQVREEQVVRKRTFGGQVVDTGGSALVRVALHESDLSKVDRDQPSVIRPLEEGAPGWMAQVVDAPDPKEATQALYCLVDTDQTAFVPEQRVFVEVSMIPSGATRKIVPYDAVLYDLHGETWVYTSPEPLVYVRAPITVDYIEGELAVLSEGPPAGTEVVTAGASELFGAETGIGGH